MSWSYSRALVVEYSEACSSDTELSAPLNTTPTPDQYYWPDKTTEHSRLSRFGMTCVPLTGSHGEELLTWYLAGSRAKTYPSPATGPDWTAKGQGFGEKWQGLLARFDRNSCSLKTAQLSLLEDLTGCCVTLPRWGLMLDGELYPQPMLEPLTRENESGFWRTPKAQDGGARGNFANWDRLEIYLAKGHTLDLSEQVRWKNLWPTPSASDCNRGGRMTENMTGQSLVQMVNTRTWPTATATAYKGWSPKHNRAESDDRLDYTVERESFRDGQKTPPMRLNPDWVEWLMGWPIGQTALKPLGTARFQEFEQQHGIYFTDKAA